MVNELTNENFNEIINSKDLVFVQVSTSWCNPCKTLTPIVEEVSDTLTNVYFGKLDADANGDTANQLGIRSVPTIIVYKNGEPVERLTGVQSKKKLTDLIEEYI